MRNSRKAAIFKLGSSKGLTFGGLFFVLALTVATGFWLNQRQNAQTREAKAALTWSAGQILAGQTGFFFNMVSDDNGVIHETHTTFGSLRYGECASDCSSASKWTFIGILAGNVGQPVIQRRANNTLDIIWRNFGTNTLNFATCPGNCLIPGNWISTQIFINAAAFGDFEYDGNGVANLVFLNNANSLRFATCAANCDNGANWNQGELVALAAADDRGVSLTFNATNNPRVSFRNATERIEYRECNAACTGGAGSWNGAVLTVNAAANQSMTSLDILTDGRAVVAFHDNVLDALRAGSCLGTCAVLGNWAFQTVDDPAAPFTAGRTQQIIELPNGDFHIVSHHFNLPEYNDFEFMPPAGINNLGMPSETRTFIGTESTAVELGCGARRIGPPPGQVQDIVCTTSALGASGVFTGVGTVITAGIGGGGGLRTPPLEQPSLKLPPAPEIDSVMAEEPFHNFMVDWHYMDDSDPSNDPKMTIFRIVEKGVLFGIVFQTENAGLKGPETFKLSGAKFNTRYEVIGIGKNEAGQSKEIAKAERFTLQARPTTIRYNRQTDQLQIVCPDCLHLGVGQSKFQVAFGIGNNLFDPIDVTGLSFPRPDFLPRANISTEVEITPVNADGVETSPGPRLVLTLQAPPPPPPPPPPLPPTGLFVPVFPDFPIRQCNDRKDNDGDGKKDFRTRGLFGLGGGDPGCTGPLDDSEVDPPAQCRDGIDNDGDGKVDYISLFGLNIGDPGCFAPFDNSEFDNKPSCDDGWDNDWDGLTDFPQDPGCTSRFDNSELNQTGGGGLFPFQGTLVIGKDSAAIITDSVHTSDFALENAVRVSNGAVAISPDIFSSTNSPPDPLLPLLTDPAPPRAPGSWAVFISPPTAPDRDFFRFSPTTDLGLPGPSSVTPNRESFGIDNFQQLPPLQGSGVSVINSLPKSLDVLGRVTASQTRDLFNPSPLEVNLSPLSENLETTVFVFRDLVPNNIYQEAIVVGSRNVGSLFPKASGLVVPIFRTAIESPTGISVEQNGGVVRFTARGNFTKLMEGQSGVQFQVRGPRGIIFTSPFSQSLSQQVTVPLPRGETLFVSARTRNANGLANLWIDPEPFTVARQFAFDPGAISRLELTASIVRGAQGAGVLASAQAISQGGLGILQDLARVGDLIALDILAANTPPLQNLRFESIIPFGTRLRRTFGMADIQFGQVTSGGLPFTWRAQQTNPPVRFRFEVEILADAPRLILNQVSALLNGDRIMQSGSVATNVSLPENRLNEIPDVPTSDLNERLAQIGFAPTAEEGVQKLTPVTELLQGRLQEEFLARPNGDAKRILTGTQQVVILRGQQRARSAEAGATNNGVFIPGLRLVIQHPEGLPSTGLGLVYYDRDQLKWVRITATFRAEASGNSWQAMVNRLGVYAVAELK